MKTIEVIGENLKENLLTVTITRKITSSTGIELSFFEDGEIKQAKIILHGKELLRHKSTTNNIISFTGTVVIDTTDYPFIGCYCTNEIIEECWLTILETETEIFQTNVSKTEFIEKAKEYYTNHGLEYSENGNLIKSFSLFKNPESLWSITKNEDTTIEVHTEVYNNLFPIIRKKGNENKIIFGEFIEEYRIRTYSDYKAFLRGITID